MSDPLDIENLATRVLSESDQPFSPIELDAMLSWLSGSERAGGAELVRRIGTPGERPDLARSVYRHLDERLFEDGRLNVRRAHVDTSVDERTRRSRFRRLMTAFHPDRSQRNAAWLTPRSQAVLAAYTEFRSGGPAQELRPMLQAVSPRPRGASGELARTSARLTPSPPALLLGLVQRLRRVSNLQGKIMLGLAIVAFLPVVIVLGASWIDGRSQETVLLPVAEPIEALATGPDYPAERAEVAHAPVVSEVSEIPEVDTWNLAPAPAPDAVAALPAETEAEPARVEPARAELAELAETAEPPGRAMAARIDAAEDLPPARPEPTVVQAPAATPAAAPATARATGSRLDVEEPPQPAVVAVILPEPTPAVPALDERIEDLLRGYARSFDRGNLDGLLTRLSSQPRENEHRGLEWFRETYSSLFADSTDRRLLIEIDRIEPGEQRWAVYGEFELRVTYADRRRPINHRAPIRYAIVEYEDGRLKIDAIDY